MLDVTATAIEQHNPFIERAVAAGEIWGLTNTEGWCIAPSNYDAEGNVDPDEEDALTVLLFWSDRAYAARCARDDWSDYEPTSIPLGEFLSGWLPYIAEKGDLVGTNWNAHLIGDEVKPLELKAELEERLEASTSNGVSR